MNYPDKGHFITLSFDRILELTLTDDKFEYDPEFNENSVTISKGLKSAYAKVARRRKVRFLAASDYVIPSKEDQEHLNANGHSRLAEVIYDELRQMYLKCA